MKKRLISFVLVAVSVFSLVGNCFAMESVDAGEISGGTSSIEPQNNRYYTVREIDPAMHREQTVTVSKAEAAIKDKAKSIIGAIIGGGSGNL